MPNSYDTIGMNYGRRRKADTRIGALIDRALGDARTVLNVGAGSGSYEPTSRSVIALEPSVEMIRQRPPSAAPAVCGIVENLPFEDDAFDATMAVNTVHHWFDKAQGFSEIRRVTRGTVVILTSDPEYRDIWLLDYFPELAELDQDQMPRLSDYERWLGMVQVLPVPVPHDCMDGFLYAYWRRPAAYLEADVRAAMSSFHALGDVSGGLHKLEADLTSGRWGARYGSLLACDTNDVGYRLVIASGKP